MQRIKEKLKQIKLPINSGTLGLFISLLAVGYVASAVQSPCLQAQATCAVGGESVFNENIQIKGGTTYAATLDASGITLDRTITIPNASGTILLGGGLGASKVVATDVSGELTTTEIYPLSIGTSGEVLTVDATNTFLEYSSITGVPSLSVSKSVSTDGTGALTTNDVYPLTLTGDSVAKTDVSGNLTTGTVDLDEISGGAASTNDEIKFNGVNWESFTPSGGGDYSLIDSGAVQNPTGNADEFLVCWGSVLDATKTYKLVLWGGSGNLPSGQTSYLVYLRPGKDDCSTGTRTEWDSSPNGNYNALYNGRIHSSATSRSQDVDLCYILQGNDPNTSTTYSANVGGTFNLRQNGSVSSSNTDRGIRIGFDVMAQMYMHPSGSNGGIQRGSGFCNWDNDLLFSDITHFYGSLDVDSAGTQQLYDKYWALYETGSQ